MKVLETGIDDLVELMEKEGSISLEKASKETGYPNDVVEDWANTLEEHGIVNMKYGLRGTKMSLNEHETEDKEQAKEKLKKQEEENYVCDECGRSFDTERGLETHEGMVH